MFEKPSGRVPRAALFLSGSGSNAVKLLEALKGADNGIWSVAALVTDRPETSAAKRIAAEFGLSDRLVELDIAKFYNERGETRVSLATERGREIREEWTDALREALRPFKPDFGVLAGFVPLSNIVGDFPCLNVHPGDLTYERDGRRILVGLHTIPIELAIAEGLSTLRSSVIAAQPYSGSGSEEMDSGPVLGVSLPVAIDFQGLSREALLEMMRERPAKRPAGGWKDALEALASFNQNKLKESGDWTVFPPVVRAFAEGRFAVENGNKLLWRELDGSWIPVSTVEFGEGVLRPLPRS